MPGSQDNYPKEGGEWFSQPDILKPHHDRLHPLIGTLGRQ